MDQKTKELKHRVGTDELRDAAMPTQEDARKPADSPEETRTLGQIVKDRRTLVLGISQQALAAKIGLGSSEYIGMVEAGQRNLDLNRVPLLAAALDLHPGDLTKIALQQYFPDAYRAVFETDKHPGTPTEQQGETGEMNNMELDQIVSTLPVQLQNPLLGMQFQLRDLALYLRRHARAKVFTSRRPRGSKP